MANLKDLKNRIKSVKSTQKITSAMKMVAAAKLRRAQDNAEQSRPYAERMKAMIADLAARTDSTNGPTLLVGNGKSENHLLVVVSADRGLCGGFNGGIIRATRREVDRLQAEGKSPKLLMVGHQRLQMPCGVNSGHCSSIRLRVFRVRRYLSMMR